MKRVLSVAPFVVMAIQFLPSGRHHDSNETEHSWCTNIAPVSWQTEPDTSDLSKEEKPLSFHASLLEVTAALVKRDERSD